MLKDKVAIITGGTRGIGFEIAKLFLKNHAKVIIFGSREESVNKALDKLKEEGFNAKGYAPLLSDMEEVRNTFAKINDEFGHSGPAVELLKEFGLCRENIAAQVRKALK